jgi:tyrosyl-tRNA synthetase
MSQLAHPNEQLEVILRGVVDLVEREELLAKLTRSAEAQKPLTVLAGFDPSAPDLHLGHTVLLRKMRQFQELGHEVIFLIGDYTARVGDPTGQKEQRPGLSADQVAENARTYEQQVHRILDPGHTRVEYNSRWLENLPLEELLSVAAKVPVGGLLSRPDLKNRSDLILHELLYPLLQAYDSVHLRVDVEVGGEDQLPNLRLGRELMAALGMEPQCLVATALLEGTDAYLEDGKPVGKKMSKTHQNTIDIDDPPEEIRRKIQRLDDTLVWRYFDLLTDTSMLQIRAFQSDLESGKRTMIEIKDALVNELLRMYQS